MATTHAGTVSDTGMEKCAHLCHECQDACLRLVPHCLSLGGAHATPAHIGMLMDCIAICGASHDLLRRGSARHVHTCAACAVICDACAEDCERLAGGDRAMEECAKVCGECAESCRAMEGR